MVLRWFWGRELSLETWHFVDVPLGVVNVWNGGQGRWARVGWDGGTRRGHLRQRESSGLREIRGGRPQRMRVWILRFTNGPGQQWWPLRERKNTICNFSALPAKSYAKILGCRPPLQEGIFLNGVSESCLALSPDCLIDSMTYSGVQMVYLGTPLGISTRSTATNVHPIIAKCVFVGTLEAHQHNMRMQPGVADVQSSTRHFERPA